jgi:hypothetical protein
MTDTKDRRGQRVTRNELETLGGSGILDLYRAR